MKRRDQVLLGTVALGVGSLLFIQWFRQRPDCDEGCQTNLEHLQEHIIGDIVRAIFG